MIASDKIPVFALAFGVAYAVIYVICTEVNLPLLTYHPAIGEVDALWQRRSLGVISYAAHDTQQCSLRWPFGGIYVR